MHFSSPHLLGSYIITSSDRSWSPGKGRKRVANALFMHVGAHRLSTRRRAELVVPLCFVHCCWCTVITHASMEIQRSTQLDYYARKNRRGGNDRTVREAFSICRQRGHRFGGNRSALAWLATIPFPLRRAPFRRRHLNTARCGRAAAAASKRNLAREQIVEVAISAGVVRMWFSVMGRRRGWAHAASVRKRPPLPVVGWRTRSAISRAS